ncbi:MAG: hypothetical protein L3K07_03615 [Thermoplasmata archaeon]|nr:hypothetical protein [Thermoplasmata archaeon]
MIRADPTPVRGAVEEVLILPCGHDVTVGGTALVIGLSHAVLEHQQSCRGVAQNPAPLRAGESGPQLHARLY